MLVYGWKCALYLPGRNINSFKSVKQMSLS